MRTTGIVTRRSVLRHNAQPGPRAGWLISMLGLALGIGAIGVILGGAGDDRRRGAPTPSPTPTDTAGLLVAWAPYFRAKRMRSLPVSSVRMSVAMRVPVGTVKVTFPVVTLPASSVPTPSAGLGSPLPRHS